MFLIGIALFAWLTFMAKGGWRGVFPTGRTLRVSFETVEGLKTADKVYFSGVPVGKVLKIDFEQQKILVTLLIDEPDVIIYRGTVIEVKDASTLGGKKVEISRGNPLKGPIDWSLPMEGLAQRSVTDALVRATDQFNQLIQSNSEEIRKITTGLAETTRILNKVAVGIEQGQGTIGLLLRDERLYENINRSTSRLADIFGALSQGEGTIGKLFSDKSIYDRVDYITKYIVAGRGTLGRLIFDDRFFDRFEGAVENTDSILRKVNEGQGSLGLLVNDEGLYRNLERITRKLASGEGTLGRLIADDTLYEGFERITENIEGITKNLGNLTAKIDKGRGSLSRLISEDTLYKKAEEAVDSARDILSTFKKFKTYVGLGAKFHSEQDMMVYRIYLRVEPDDDKFFMVGASWLSLDKNGEVDYDGRNDGDRDDDTFFFMEALAGYKFFDNFLTLKLGIIEGRFGGGIDLDFNMPFLYDTSLRFSFEARMAFADKDFDGAKINENIEPFLFRFEVSMFLFRHIRLFFGGNNLEGLFDNIAWSAGLSFEYNEEDVRNLLGLFGLAK